MRVVLDTNVLIAAFITRGVCSGVLEHCIRRHKPVTAEYILNELRGHMTRKFGYSAEEAEEAIELLRSGMEVVKPADLGTAVCRDPDDDMILGTAIAGRAVCIVTGDNDLLVIERYRGIDVLRPAEFAEYEASCLEETA